MRNDVSEKLISSLPDVFIQLLHAIFFLDWFSTFKMEVLSFSETSVHIWTTRRYIPEDGNIHNYRSENLKFRHYLGKWDKRENCEFVN
jgi:hypothetical protein